MGKPSLRDCSTGSDAVGATRVFIEPERQAPSAELPEIHAASARVSYRLETTSMPLRFSADRRIAVVTVDDELLRGADLRCVSASALNL